MQESSKTEIEIERKWLLRNDPFIILQNFYPDEILWINQWYVTIDGVNRRIRLTTSDFGRKHEWVMIHKESISEGVNNEHHYPITEEEAALYIKDATKSIFKSRLVKNYDGFKIEVDVFQDIKLVMMEIELPSLDYEFEMPAEILPHIISEVTGYKAFDNFNLAYTINKTI